MNFLNPYKTVVVSDVSLGTSRDYTKLLDFLKVFSCDTLVFCGEIIQGLSLAGEGPSKELQSIFINDLAEVAEKNHTQIVFVTGDHYAGDKSFSIENFTFSKDYSFTTSGKRYHVLPGEVTSYFQSSTFGFLDPYYIKYNLLLWLNRNYNHYNQKKGKSYESVFNKFPEVKKDEDIGYAFLSRFKHDLIELSIEKDCEGVIGGHLHFSGIYHFGGISYLNPGYWSESMTALAETRFGMWRILNYEQMVEERKDEKIHQDIQEELFNESIIDTYVSKTT